MDPQHLLKELGMSLATMSTDLSEQTKEINRLRTLEAQLNLVIINARNRKLTDTEFREFVMNSFDSDVPKEVIVRLHRDAHGNVRPYGYLTEEARLFIVNHYGRAFKAVEHNMNYYRLVNSGHLVHVYNASVIKGQ